MQVHSALKVGSIDHIRRPHGLTLQEFADALGISYATLSRANTGRPCQPLVIRRLRAWLKEQGDDPNILRDLVVEPQPTATAGAR